MTMRTGERPMRANRRGGLVRHRRREADIPKDIVAVFDAPRFVDRYTVVLDRSVSESTPGYHPMLGLSDDPESPWGFSQFSDGVPGRHLGRRIRFRALPPQVQAHITRRLQNTTRSETHEVERRQAETE